MDIFQGNFNYTLILYHFIIFINQNNQFKNTKQPIRAYFGKSIAIGIMEKRHIWVYTCLCKGLLSNTLNSLETREK